jgi:hypothetical protein
MSKNPHFLDIELNRQSTERAKRTVIDYLIFEGIQSPQGGWERSKFNLGTDGPVSFNQLVTSTREFGTVPYIQAKIDNTDEIFGGTFGFATPTALFGTVSSTYAGFTRTLISPMLDQPVEDGLAEDILFYREESCLYSDEYDFIFCTRYYRAYLSACISLVDAFINRHILIWTFKKISHPDLETLKTTTRLEDRLELFLKIAVGKDLTSINGGVEWQHFKKLRVLRNGITHISGPSLGYSIHEFAEHYNYVKTGIGGLLYNIRKLQGKMSLGFIERLRTAPSVFFNEITHREDGKHIIKRRK